MAGLQSSGKWQGEELHQSDCREKSLSHVVEQLEVANRLPEKAKYVYSARITMKMTLTNGWYSPADGHFFTNKSKDQTAYLLWRHEICFAQLMATKLSALQIHSQKCALR